MTRHRAGPDNGSALPYRRFFAVGVTAASLTVVLVACSKGSSPVPGSTTGATTSGTVPATGANNPPTSGASGPHATESNPAGDIPDTQAFVTYTPPGQSFSVQIPEGWSRTTSGQATLFTDKYNSIRVESIARPAAITVAYAQNTEIAGIRASTPNFSPGKVQSVQRKAGTAILITYRTDSAPNPVTGKVAVEAVERYEFWRNGTEVVLTLSAPVGSDNVDPWRKITDSFSWRA
jgi:hypothetical protein